jgi:hypothetical protein
VRLWDDAPRRRFEAASHDAATNELNISTPSNIGFARRPRPVNILWIASFRLTQVIAEEAHVVGLRNDAADVLDN